jgi:fructokinase
MIHIGIDMGGTKIEGVVLDEQHRELFRKRVATQAEQGYDAILNRIENLVRELADRTPAEPYTLGIGAPGVVSPETGLMKNSNTVCLNGRPVKADLERRLGRPLAMQNDANCFALAEARLGAGRGRKLVFGVILGTGCGGGLVYNGEVITGPQGIAGEWGHMSINPEGPLCFCGRRGCVETYISGGGLQARYREQFGIAKTMEGIEADYRRGDPAAVQFIGEFLRHFGRALANLIDVLDPDAVVLGGGVSKFAELYTLGVAEVAKCVFNDTLTTPILRHELGDSAGVLGAALTGI